MSPAYLREAAAFLVEHPERYNFTERKVPATLEDNGCMWGWAMYFAGNAFGDFGEFDYDEYTKFLSFCRKHRPKLRTKAIVFSDADAASALLKHYAHHLETKEKNGRKKI